MVVGMKFPQFDLLRRNLQRHGQGRYDISSSAMVGTPPAELVPCRSWTWGRTMWGGR